MKNRTALTSGSVSVAQAAVNFITRQPGEFSEKKILLVGTGKIGRNTCLALTKYVCSEQVTLINRTFEKASLLARQTGFKCTRVKHLTDEIAKADIIITATAANAPFIGPEHFKRPERKLFIDLSVPANVDARAIDFPHISLVTIDMLSTQVDNTLQRRLAAVPEALEIIEEHMQRCMVKLSMHHERALESVNIVI
ncbi:MAG: NAD(P)-binding domain-containing protein [Mucilaginibacter sp.]